MPPKGGGGPRGRAEESVKSFAETFVELEPSRDEGLEVRQGLEPSWFAKLQVLDAHGGILDERALIAVVVDAIHPFLVSLEVATRLEVFYSHVEVVLPFI